MQFADALYAGLCDIVESRRAFRAKMPVVCTVAATNRARVENRA